VRLKASPDADGLMAKIHVPKHLFDDVKRVRDHLLWRALETSIELRAPFQIHAGLGDQDLDIQAADPGLLAQVMRDRRLRSARIVLLHGAYPYHEKAAYLANVFPNVYVDLSLFNPFLVSGTARVLCSMLELAPFTKLLASTDAYGSPELHWIGVRHARTSLAAAIEASLDWSARQRQLGQAIWRSILRDNAAELYGLVEAEGRARR
jgi:predicted TIM-barrel fold metal-dependent hydrolase